MNLHCGRTLATSPERAADSLVSLRPLRRMCAAQSAGETRMPSRQLSNATLSRRMSTRGRWDRQTSGAR